MRSEPYESIDYGAGDEYRIQIFRDDDASNPRTEWDNVGTMTCFHSRYNLGDKHDFRDPDELMRELAGDDFYEALDNEYDALIAAAYDIEGEAGKKRRKELSDEFNTKVWDEIQRRYVILPLYLYDHSGITMRCEPFSCPWDSGQVGWIYCSVEKAREEWFSSHGDKYLEQAEKYLAGEVATYDQYLTGDVFGYVAEYVKRDEDGEIIEDEVEEVGSCWGFFGDQYSDKEGWEYMLSEAKSECDYDFKKRFPLLVPIIEGDGSCAS